MQKTNVLYHLKKNVMQLGGLSILLLEECDNERTPCILYEQTSEPVNRKFYRYNYEWMQIPDSK